MLINSKILSTVLIIVVFTVVNSFDGRSSNNVLLEDSVSNSDRFYFSKAANTWNEAIPIGNGRLGGMIFGKVGNERIQTNDDTFWSGEPRDLQIPGAYHNLAEIRKKLNQDSTAFAQRLINRDMLGPFNQSYMPLADILLNMDSVGVTGYRRELDLRNGLVNVSYNKDGINFRRSIFASYPDQCIVVHLTADKPGAINVNVNLKSLVKYRSYAFGKEVIINGQAPWHVEPNYEGKHDPVYKDGRGMRFEGHLIVQDTDGIVNSGENGIDVQAASVITLIFVAATSYNGPFNDPFVNGKNETQLCEKYISQLKNRGYNDLLQRHRQDFTTLFGRVGINFGKSTSSHLPIDQRIKKYPEIKDPSLMALYFQFGRYLLISSSRPGSQPMNLQGIWSNLLQPAWSSNWTINCNAQINYWPVELVNLSECHLPLMDMIKEVTLDGSKTAKNLYNARGWVAHHNIDIWRTTWPVGGSGLWAIYQVGGAWLSQHIWEHYQFTQDKEFLRSNFSVLNEASRFYLDILQTDKSGHLVTNPSISFENHFVKQDGEKGWACIGSSQDMQIIRALFKNTLAAIKVLGVRDTLRIDIEKAYKKLAPMKISSRTGQLQEWNEDWDAANPNSDQVAQGWGLIASDLITPRGTPDLALALKKTLSNRRPGFNSNAGSWTGAFAAGYWARLFLGDSVQKVIDRHFQLALYPNLTSQFAGFWQIDGNMGITSAIGEMLLQSHAGEIELLPALPSGIGSGNVTGLKARGGFEVDIFWKGGLMEKAIIKSQKKSEATIRYQDRIKTIQVGPFESVELLEKDF